MRVKKVHYQDQRLSVSLLWVSKFTSDGFSVADRDKDRQTEFPKSPLGATTVSGKSYIFTKPYIPCL